MSHTDLNSGQAVLSPLNVGRGVLQNFDFLDKLSLLSEFVDTTSESANGYAMGLRLPESYADTIDKSLLLPIHISLEPRVPDLLKVAAFGLMGILSFESTRVLSNCGLETPGRARPPLADLELGLPTTNSSGLPDAPPLGKSLPLVTVSRATESDSSLSITLPVLGTLLSKCTAFVPCVCLHM